MHCVSLLLGRLRQPLNQHMHGVGVQHPSPCNFSMQRTAPKLACTADLASCAMQTCDASLGVVAADAQCSKGLQCCDAACANQTNTLNLGVLLFCLAQ